MKFILVMIHVMTGLMVRCNKVYCMSRVSKTTSLCRKAPTVTRTPHRHERAAFHIIQQEPRRRHARRDRLRSAVAQC